MLALVGAAFIFGTTFTTVKRATEEVAPLPLLTVRFAFGVLVLLPIVRRRPRSIGVGRAGIAAGVALAIGYVTQTVGLQYTDESTSAFITYMLVVFVPLIQAVLLRRFPRRAVVLGVSASAVGLFLLSGASSGTLGLGRGELLTLACAFGFAIHILVLDRVASSHDVIWLNVVQLGVVAVVCAVPGLLTGGYRFPLSAWMACAYLGVVASAGAFFLQTWAQARVEPTRASLLLMLEPVFAAGLSAILGHALGPRGIVGAVFISIGIVVVEAGRARADVAR